MVSLQYIGHSAFYIKTGDYGILIDPFISGNPKAVFDLKNNKTQQFYAGRFLRRYACRYFI